MRTMHPIADGGLAFRLPNPPPLFVGRLGELEALSAAIDRGPLAVVYGPGGIGKTALVLHALHARFLGEVDARCVYVRLRSADPGVRPALVDAGRSMLRALGVQCAADAVHAAVLDALDGRGLVAVVDDLHHADLQTALPLFEGIARYARRARVVLVGRMRVPLDAAEPAVSVPPLGPEDLDALARALAPALDPPARARAVTAACGSPFRLRHALELGPSRAPTDAALDEPPGAIAVLRALEVLERPVPERVVRRLAACDAAVVEALVTRGMVERLGGGLLLHEAARPAVGEALAPAARLEECARVAGVLVSEGAGGASTSLPLILEAARLWLAVGEAERARQILLRSLAPLVASGYAPDLWEVLREQTDPSFAGVRLRVAVELGRPGALAAVHPVDGADLAERFAWGRVLLSRGEASTAAAHLIDVAGAAERAGDVALHADARLLAARALGGAGRPEDVLACLEPLRGALAPEDERQHASALSLRARALAHLGRRGEARDLLAEAERVLGRCEGLAALELGYTVLTTRYNLGDLARAEALADRLLPAVDGAGFAAEMGRHILHLGSLLRLARGRLAEADVLLGRLSPFAYDTPALRPYHLAVCAMHALLMGDEARVREDLTRLEGEARSLRAEHPLRQSALSLRLRAATLFRGAFPPPREDPAASDDFAVLYVAQRRAREGEAVDVGALVSSDKPEVRAIARDVRAQAQIAAGDAWGAHATLEGALADVAATPYVVAHAHLLLTWAAACAACADRRGLAAGASQLAQVTAHFASPRFDGEVRLWRAAAGGELHADVLSACAEDPRSPEAARRARALLGDGADLDAVDVRVVEGLRGSCSFRRAARVQSEPPPPGAAWALDERGAVAVGPFGRVDFVQHPQLWRVLVALAERGGRATKEELWRAAWREGEYHPLRHDNRLRLAARKIRARLGDDASAPRYLRTTDDGYALVGDVRLIVGA